ncbi:putative hydrolase of the HAD superfamily [Pelagirhabdus alkalitolerans]|uniref:Phosphoserine phosphatase n=1 Tax=Pelagirhabdus alkalitolerans TaxID=1612202 RepID=A0A1G6LDD6_9BACI|nr:HAD family hydrolase [Pelagirhabdus alkalitolerans]SDC41214.1 putative hydrolase of the HAD superfamily [Pelagirhabdus alkalitolerans]
MVNTLFFDLDDTLLWDKQSIQLAFDETVKRVDSVDSKVLEKHVREQAQVLYQTYPTYAFTKMIGINPFEGLWGTFNDPGEGFQDMFKIIAEYRQKAWYYGLKACGIDDWELAKKLSNQFITERMKHPVVYDDTFATLDELKNDYQLLMLTNGSPSLQRTKLKLTEELKPYFEEIIISGEFGRGKPDPRIFEHALNRMDKQPHEVIMIGDNLNTDILGANRTGIQSIWINHHGKKADEIKPTYEVQSLSEIIPLLKQLNDN